MKYIKLFLVFLLLVSFTPISAIDLLEPDNEAIIPEVEPLKIDLEAIKKKSKIQNSIPAAKKEKKNVKTGKSKTGKSSAVKKKTTRKKQSVAASRKSADKFVKKVKQTSDKSKITNKQNETINIKADDDKIFRKTEKSDSTYNQLSNTDKISDANKKLPVEKSADIEKKEIPILHTDIIINPLEKEISKIRLYKITYDGIAKWVKPQGLKVREDAPPVVDGVAFYTPEFFAEFKVEGYDRRKDYKLFIDFVRFDGEAKHINSLLKIWGRDFSGKMYLIAEINRQILKEDKIFETLIPYQLSSPGRFDIIVREYSDTPGKWGIWDMIITDKKIDHVELLKPDASEKMKVIESKIFK